MWIYIYSTRDEKYGNKVRDQIVWKRVRDGALGSLKSEIKLKDH